MEPNTWHNTRTDDTANTRSNLGSPRAWLFRAQESADHTPYSTSLAPGDITVAGIWPRGVSIPFVSEHASLIRLWRIPARPDLSLASRCTPVAVTGVAVSAPDSAVTWLRYQMQQAGAVWIWWDHSTPRQRIAVDHTETVRTRTVREGAPVDQDLVLAQLASGLSSKEIGVLHNCSYQNINYIRRVHARQLESQLK